MQRLASLYDPAPQIPSAERWQRDRHCSVVARRSTATQRTNYYVCGDILHLSREAFPSLVRTDNTPNTGVEKIRFDARVLIVDMSLHFDTARVEMFAESIVWTGAGELRMREMPQTGGDGLWIVAQHLDMRPVLTEDRRPFVFTTNDWSYLTDATKPAWPDDRKRVVDVQCCHLTTGSQITANDDEAVFEWFRSLTLDRRYALDGQNSRRPYHLRIGGPAAQERYETVLTQESRWPLEFGDKIARLFSAGPYVADDNAFLVQQCIAPYRGLFQQHYPSALSRLQQVESAIRNGTDLFGRTRYYTPRLSFAVLRQRFAQALETNLKIAEDWEAAILEAHHGTAVDASRLKMSQEQQEKNQTTRQRLLDGMSQKQLTLETIQQQVEGCNQRLESERIVLEHKLQTLIAQNAANAQLLQTTKILAAAAALIPVAAPVALLVGQAISITGQVIYANNKNTPIGVGGLIDLVAKNTEFIKKVRDMGAKWNDLKKSVDEAPGSKSIYETVKAFGESANGVYGELSLPAPQKLDLNGLEQEELKKPSSPLSTIIRELEALRKQESAALRDTKEMQTALDRLLGEITQVGQDMSLVLAVKVRNDAEIAEQRAAGIRVREMALGDLRSMAGEARRACCYHCNVPASDLLNEVPDPLRFELPERMSSAALMNPDTSTAELRDSMVRQRSEIKKVYEAVGFILNREINNWEDAGKQLSLVPYGFSARSSEKASDRQSGFLEALNRSICEQIESKAEVKPAPPPLIYVPLEEYDQSSHSAEKMIHAQVDNVIVSNPASMSGKRLHFRVHHPLFGFVQSGGGSYTVDMRRPGGQSDTQPWVTVWDENGVRDPQQIYELYPTIKDEYLKYAILPLRTHYYVEVEVLGDVTASTWRDAPQLDQIEIVVWGLQ